MGVCHAINKRRLFDKRSNLEQSCNVQKHSRLKFPWFTGAVHIVKHRTRDE